ncbi:HigA family addiction module antidote protein [candidate division KSB1 bacterium]|nr:HigA family addiction module antidote protein [candidate division KSB1 bacterium]
MMIRENYHSDLAIPPGEYLGEVLPELGMTKNELARRMNRPAPKLSVIFNGEKASTPDTALQLEKVTGVPAHIWVGLESQYRLTLARNSEAAELHRLKEESVLIPKYCYSELVKLGKVVKKTKSIEKVQELHRFFGVTSLHTIASLKRYEAIFRQGKGNRSPEATATWLRIGELEGQKTNTAPFNKADLSNTLPCIRKMSLLTPDTFLPKLEKVLMNAGVVLVLFPHFPKTFLRGATFKMGSNKAVLMLTIRGSWADIFWFSFFHEIGHLLLHDKTTVFLEDDRPKNDFPRFEKEADHFAANTLIQQNAYLDFVKTGSFFSDDIELFARSLEIDPGIVVGRLHHDGYIMNSWHNKLRSKYEWDAS